MRRGGGRVWGYIYKTGQQEDAKERGEVIIFLAAPSISHTRRRNGKPVPKKEEGDGAGQSEERHIYV